MTREGELGRRVSPRQLPAVLLLSPFLVTSPLICLLLSTTSIIKRDQSHQGYTGHVSQLLHVDTDLGHLNHLLVSYQLRRSIIMSLALCKALSALSFWNPLVVRTFSSSVIGFADAGCTEEFAEELSVADKQKEARARQVAVQRAYLQRVRADPERLKRYKSARSIASKKQYQRITKDPERYEKIKIANAISNKELYQRIKKDPKRYKEYLSRKQKELAIAYKSLSWRDKHAAASQRWQDRKREEDPAFVERRREGSLQHYRKNAATIEYRMRRSFALWTQHPWVCELPWKTHTPIYSQEKVRHVCATCGSYRIDGTKYVCEGTDTASQNSPDGVLRCATFTCRIACKVLLSVTENVIAPMGQTQSLSTAVYVTTGEGLVIRYGSVVVYRHPERKFTRI
jgi:hypothetical protein